MKEENKEIINQQQSGEKAIDPDVTLSGIIQHLGNLLGEDVLEKSKMGDLKNEE